jgi:hypothetical protein
LRVQHAGLGTSQKDVKSSELKLSGAIDRNSAVQDVGTALGIEAGVIVSRPVRRPCQKPTDVAVDYTLPARSRRSRSDRCVRTHCFPISRPRSANPSSSLLAFATSTNPDCRWSDLENSPRYSRRYPPRLRRGFLTTANASPFPASHRFHVLDILRVHVTFLSSSRLAVSRP